MLERRQKLTRAVLLTALFVWSGLAYVELGKFMYKGILFARNINGRPYVSDFANHYNAGVLAARCLSEKVDVYDIDVQNKSLQKLIAPVVPEQPFYLQYPPYFFLLALPLSLMPMTVAWIVWNLLGIGLSIFAVFKLINTVEGNLDAKKAILPVALIFSSYPAWLSTELGQTSIYLVAVLVFMLVLLRANKNFAAGISCGFLMIKLQYAPIFLLLGLIRGGARFLLGWIICLIAFLGASIGVLGIDNVMRFPHALLSGETGQAVSGVSEYMMQNVRGELAILAPGAPSSITFPIVLSFFALGVGIAAFLNWKAAQSRSPEAIAFAFALSILVGLLTSPHTHIQDMILVGISGVLVASFIENANDKWGVLTRRLFVAFPFVSWFLFYAHPLFLIVRVQPFFVYLTVLAISTFFCMRSRNFSNN